MLERKVNAKVSKYEISNMEFHFFSSFLGLLWRCFRVLRFKFLKMLGNIMILHGVVVSGTDDEVKCYTCDIGLRSWDPKDIPVLEHIKYRPKCSFVRDIQKHLQGKVMRLSCDTKSSGIIF